MRVFNPDLLTFTSFRTTHDTRGGMTDGVSVKLTDIHERARAGDDGQPEALGDAIADNTSTTATLSVGGSAASLIDSNGDRDYFAISLTAGQTYVFTLTATNPNGLGDPYLELRTAGDALAAENDDGGLSLNSLLMYTAPTTGTYYLVARAWSTETGSYTIAAQTMDSGNSSPTQFTSSGLPVFSWDQAAIQLTRSGASWSQSGFGQSVLVTYAFRSTAPATMPDDATGFQRFSAAQIAAAEAALQAWAGVANIVFVRVGTGAGDAAYSNNAAILFSNYTSGVAGAAAFAYLPSHGTQAASSVQGDVWVNISQSANLDLSLGGYGRHVLLHEIGHAIGLRHPGDYNADGETTATYGNDAEYFQDSRAFTAMSYFASSNVGANLGLYSSAPQLHDIAGAQRLYGANTDTRAGDTVYGFNSTSGLEQSTLTSASQYAVFSIWDGGGTDTLDLSGYSQHALIDLREEAFSSAGPGQIGPGSVYNISIARGAVIENAIGGAGSDTIIGNASNNAIQGGSGADTISGGAGADRLDGGSGDDTLLGEAGDDLLIASNGNDWVAGGDGADVLYAGQPGTDILIGGAGHDTATFIWSGVGVYLDVGAGVYAGSGVWTVFQEIEAYEGSNLADTMLGSANGEFLLGAGGTDTIIALGGDDVLIGGAGDDWLDGGDGDDVLEGNEGVNILIGGAGLDLASYGSQTANLWIDLSAGVYAATGVWDVFYQSIDGAIGGVGHDVIIAAAAGSILLGGAGDDTLIGGAGGDTLAGGDGADWIVGGAGNDRLDGGAGVDIYTAGAGADVFALGAANAGWDVAYDFNPNEDRFDLGGQLWLGLVAGDWDGDGQDDDTMLGYAGGNFVALDVSGLTLAQWNALVI